MSAARHLLDLFYPPRCYACDAPAPCPGFCATCAHAILPTAPARCRVCDHPITTRGGSDRVCGRCLLDPPAFDRARACAAFHASDGNDPLRAALHRYKYGRETALANGLGTLFAAHGRASVRPRDIVLPVPLHIDRLRWRGFNQALLLARRLCRDAGAQLDVHSLVRRRATLPQVELDEGARRRNVVGAFRVARPERIAGRRVLLVDDVMTTGATVDECSRALRRAGAVGVEVLVLARAVRD